MVNRKVRGFNGASQKNQLEQAIMNGDKTAIINSLYLICDRLFYKLNGDFIAAGVKNKVHMKVDQLMQDIASSNLAHTEFDCGDDVRVVVNVKNSAIVVSLEGSATPLVKRRWNEI